MSYRVVLTATAHREWLALPSEARRRLSPVIDDLAHHPRTPAARALGGHLRGKHRVAVNEWRIAYHVDDLERTVTVALIADRREVYERTVCTGADDP